MLFLTYILANVYYTHDNVIISLFKEENCMPNQKGLLKMTDQLTDEKLIELFRGSTITGAVYSADPIQNKRIHTLLVQQGGCTDGHHPQPGTHGLQTGREFGS
jgi:hypothetical protein